MTPVEKGIFCTPACVFRQDVDRMHGLRLLSPEKA